MCLIVFDWQPGSDQWLTLSANRDEFFNRPARPLSAWPEQPSLFAGQDLQQGGTWLGMSQNGRWAALTNVRAPGAGPENPVSRGELALGYLTSGLPPDHWLHSVQAERYAPFNLLVGTPETAWYLTNHPGIHRQRLTPGLHGLSNAALNTPWPKVVLAQQQLRERTPGTDLTTLLNRRTPFADDLLPATGVTAIWEKLLSAQFIQAPGYGTRCSTSIQTQGPVVRMEEVTWNDAGEGSGHQQLTFSVSPE